MLAAKVDDEAGAGCVLPSGDAVDEGFGLKNEDFVRWKINLAGWCVGAWDGDEVHEEVVWIALQF